MKSKKRWTLLFLAAYGLGLLIFAPARLASALLQQQTSGQMWLNETGGTLWQGQGRLMIQSGGKQLQLGTLAWHISTPHLLLASLDISLKQEFEGRSGKASIALGPQSLEIREADLALPAAVLVNLNPILAAFNPEGRLLIRSQKFQHERTRGQYNGKMRFDWDPAMVLQGRQAGPFRLDIDARDTTIESELKTLAGPLWLDGKATGKTGAPFEFNGKARLSPATEDSHLKPLFLSLCPRGGDECAIKITGSRRL